MLMYSPPIKIMSRSPKWKLRRNIHLSSVAIGDFASLLVLLSLTPAWAYSPCSEPSCLKGSTSFHVLWEFQLQRKENQTSLRFFIINKDCYKTMEQCLQINEGKSVLVYNSISTQSVPQKQKESKDILGHEGTQKA